MEPNVLIVFAILIFMIVGLMTHFLPYGIVGMICCVAFVLTGVCDLKTAFSGLGNSTTILVACMIVVATQLSRTSIVGKLRKSLEQFQGKKGIFVLIPLFAVTIVLSSLMGQIACLSLLLTFIQSLDDDSDTSPARIFFVVCVLNTIWAQKLPYGMGATMGGTINGFAQGLLPEGVAVGMFDYCKAGIIPAIVGLIYCLLFYKLVPHTKLNYDNAPQKSSGQLPEKLSSRDEAIIWAVFAMVTLGFMFQKRIGADIANTLPAAAVLILIITKVLSLEGAVKILTGDMVWMIASMQVMSTVLANTGVGDMIGNTVLNILGSNPSPMFVAAVFSIAAALMTNFMTNLGTQAIMTPIAAATAIAGGMNPIPIILIVNISAWFAFVLPTASPGALMAFGISGQNPLKAMKFTLPLFVLEIVSLILTINLFYPIYL